MAGFNVAVKNMADFLKIRQIITAINIAGKVVGSDPDKICYITTFGGLRSMDPDPYQLIYQVFG